MIEKTPEDQSEPCIFAKEPHIGAVYATLSSPNSHDQENNQENDINAYEQFHKLTCSS